MDDERIERRPALGREHPQHGLRVERIRGQAIDRLGGHADQQAGLQRGRGRGDIHARSVHMPGIRQAAEPRLDCAWTCLI